MKRIDDVWNLKLDHAIKKLIEKERRDISDEDPEFNSRMLRTYQKITSFYGLENIRDLDENYAFLSTPRLEWRLYGRMLLENIRQTSKTRKKLDEELQISTMEQVDLNELLHDKISFNINTKYCEMDNVYLEDFKFRKDYSFELCECIVRDIHGEKIRGIAVYRLGRNKDEELLESISKAIDSGSIETFDLGFQVLEKKREINRIYHSHEEFMSNDIRKIQIEQIIKHRGRYSENDIEPIDNTVVKPELILK